MAMSRNTYAQYAQPAVRPFSGYAIASFILSLLWLGGIGSLIGLVLSISAMRQTSSGERSGQGLAVSALILSILGVVGGTLILIYSVVAGFQLENQFASVDGQVAG